jgi:hypothetical protein
MSLCKEDLIKRLKDKLSNIRIKDIDETKIIENLNEKINKFKLLRINTEPLIYKKKSNNNNKISIKEKIEKNLTYEEIIEIIKSSIKICNCGNKYIYNINCNLCYNIPYEHNNIWEEIEKYNIKEGLIECKFCLRNKTSGIKFHFDHINIYDKKESICTMVRENYNIDDIICEIKKCQLLCVDCHNIVTKIERLYGFIEIKKDMKKYDGNIKELYTEKMDYVYSVLKNNIKQFYNI